MGLGKTVQTLAWLEKEHQKDPEKKVLLVVPASLIANWRKEASQFTPDLSVGILHGKKAVDAFKTSDKVDLPFLNLTTYGIVSRLDALKDIHWDFLVLDQAQAIKNPKTRQTSSVKGLQAHMRLAMTGTPIENDLINLWSIFDSSIEASWEHRKSLRTLFNRGRHPSRTILESCRKPFLPFCCAGSKAISASSAICPIKSNRTITLS